MGKIQIQCERCSSRLAVPDSAVGEKIRCPKCQEIILVTDGKRENVRPLPEKITVRCTSCFATLAVPDSAAGKKIRCPKCQRTIDVAVAGLQEATSNSTRSTAPPRPLKPASEATEAIGISKANGKKTFVLIACVSLIAIAIASGGFLIFRSEQSRITKAAEMQFEDAKKKLLQQKITEAESLLNQCVLDDNLSEVQRETARGLLSQLKQATSKDAIESSLLAMTDEEFASAQAIGDVTSLTFSDPTINELKRNIIASLIPDVARKRDTETDARMKARQSAEAIKLESEVALTRMAEIKLLQCLDDLKAKLKAELSPVTSESENKRFWAAFHNVAQTRKTELVAKSLKEHIDVLDSSFPTILKYMDDELRNVDSKLSQTEVTQAINNALKEVIQVCIEKNHAAADELFESYWEDYQDNKIPAAKWLGDAASLRDVWWLFKSPKYSDATFELNSAYAVYCNDGLIDSVLSSISTRSAPGLDFYGTDEPSEGRFNAYDIVAAMHSVTYSSLLSNESEMAAFRPDNKGRIRSDDYTKGTWDTINLVRKTGITCEMVVREIPDVGWECIQSGFVATSLPELLIESQDIAVRNAAFRSHAEPFFFFAPVKADGRELTANSPNNIDSSVIQELSGRIRGTATSFSEEEMKEKFEATQALRGILRSRIPLDNSYNRIPEKRLLRFTAAEIPRWLVFEDKLSVEISSSAGDISVLRTEVLPETKEVAFSCSLDVSKSGNVEIDWKDKSDPMGASGKITCEIRYFKPTSLMDVIDGSPTVTEWHSPVSEVTEKTTLQNKSTEQSMVVKCLLSTPVFGVASFPPSLEGQGAIEMSADGNIWGSWQDLDTTDVLPTSFFANPSKQIFFRGKIPAKASVSLSFLFSPDTNVWKEVTGP